VSAPAVAGPTSAAAAIADITLTKALRFDMPPA
jgi:hypothetical protein